MSITIPELPYSMDALEPYISSRTLEFHYGKHHSAYANNLNKLVMGTPLEKETLQYIVCKTANNPDTRGIFNNAAQVWNHSFYWECMKPGGGGKPPEELLDIIKRDFGGFEAFLAAMKEAGTTQFGSGWAWLVLEEDRLKIIKTSNADLPKGHFQKPLLTIDVWEHAYYLDYQNRRPDYISTFLDHLVNWEFVFSRLARKTEEDALAA